MACVSSRSGEACCRLLYPVIAKYTRVSRTLSGRARVVEFSYYFTLQYVSCGYFAPLACSALELDSNIFSHYIYINA